MDKTKVLNILHYSPPVHGASKIGDLIFRSQKIKDRFENRFIKIKASNTISDIGKFGILKLLYTAELFTKIIFSLILFNPEKIYFTVSTNGFAFYRDVLISILFKVYIFFNSKTELYYHYHTRGIDDFVKKSKIKLILNKFILKEVNLIILSPELLDDFKKVKVYKSVSFLPNGIEDAFETQSFNDHLDTKFSNQHNKVINVLFLSNMIKSKGYDYILNLANELKDQNYKFHFAGNWKRTIDEVDFHKFIETNKLKNIKFHGYVNSEEKDKLFRSADILVYPSMNDAFPLVVLESLSYGVPIISSAVGALKEMNSYKSGYIVEDLNSFVDIFKREVKRLVDKRISIYCRNWYADNYTLNKFEDNFIDILNN